MRQGVRIGNALMMGSIGFRNGQDESKALRFVRIVGRVMGKVDEVVKASVLVLDR